MRLPALWPFVVILAIGSAVVAVGYQHQWDWKIIVSLRECDGLLDAS